MRDAPANKRYVPGRVARLREVSGHNGPWSDAEYREAIGDVYPTDETPDPPEEVVKAAERVEVCRAAYDEAQRAYMDASRAVHRAVRDAGSAAVSLLTRVTVGKDAHAKKLAELKAAANAAEEARDVAAERLRKARVAHSTAVRRWEADRRAAKFSAATAG